MLQKLVLSAMLLVSLNAIADGVQSVNLKNEVYDENVKVSAELRSGVMYADDSKTKISLPPKFIYLDLGKGGVKTICGKLISADGQYEAAFSTNDLSSDLGVVKIKLNSKFKNVIKEYSYNEITVLAYESTSRCKKVGRILPVSWFDKIDNVLVVYLNSGQFETSILIYKNGNRKPIKIPCNKIDGNKQIAYDTLCRVKIENDFDLSRTKIKRSNGSSYAKVVKLPIQLNLQ